MTTIRLDDTPIPKKTNTNSKSNPNQSLKQKKFANKKIASEAADLANDDYFFLRMSPSTKFEKHKNLRDDVEVFDELSMRRRGENEEDSGKKLPTNSEKHEDMPSDEDVELIQFTPKSVRSEFEKHYERIKQFVALPQHREAKATCEECEENHGETSQIKKKRETISLDKDDEKRPDKWDFEKL
jgi:hypothetical protein